MDSLGRSPTRPENGVADAARQLGLDRNEVRRTIKIASLSPEAQAVSMSMAMDMDMWEPYFKATLKHVPGAAGKIVHVGCDTNILSGCR